MKNTTSVDLMVETVDLDVVELFLKTFKVDRKGKKSPVQLTATADTYDEISAFLKSVGAKCKTETEWAYNGKRVLPLWDNVDSKWFVIIQM